MAATHIVQCPECQVSLKVPVDRTRIRCPKCESPFDVAQPVAASRLAQPAASAGTLTAVPPSPSLAPAAGVNGRAGFPALQADGETVDPTDCIEPGTSARVMLAYVSLGLGLLFLGLVTWGIGLLIALFSPLINYFNHRKTLALVHGSGIHVGPQQFPEIHRCVETMWERLGRGGDPPEVYIVEDSVMNAAAVKLGRKNLVLLTDDMIHGALASSDPRTLAFVIGHELAHAALKHNSALRVSMAATVKSLSRLDEYTADRVATRLVGDKKVAAEGIVLLTVGPHLLPYTNYVALRQQVAEVAANKQSKNAERKLTHPLLLHRLGRAWGDAG
jgi:Zn-dependent protease with chaperone function